MPPIKGRMMGLAQSKIDFKNIKGLKDIHQGKKMMQNCNANRTPLPDGIKKDKALMRLRIPSEICKVLPSVRKFHPKGSSPKYKVEEYENAITIDDDDDDDIKPVCGDLILGLRRRRGEQNKYRIKQLSNKSFGTMIWDLAFIPNSQNLVVSTASGAFICDIEHLDEKCRLEHIVFGGGISFLSNGNIVIVCRNSDTVHIFSPAGEHIRSFPAGVCPMCVAVNSKDEIITTDTSEKNICIFSAHGTLIHKIKTTGPRYELKWPLYIDVTTDQNSIVVSDLIKQEIMVFDTRGCYTGSLPLKTFGGNEVLRPHGLCVNSEHDLFIVDSAIDTVEVFHEDGTYLQTLVHSSEGTNVKPKVVRTSGDGCYMMIGGLTGHVTLFKFLVPEGTPPSIAVKQEKSDVIVID